MRQVESALGEVVLFLKTPWPDPVPAEPQKLPLSLIEVSRSWRPDLSEQVRKALGDVFFDEWRHANVFATADCDDDGVAGAPAAERISSFYYALWLHGLLHIDSNAFAMTVEDGATLGRIAGFELLYGPRYVKAALGPLDLDADGLLSVDQVAAGITARNQRQAEFRRLWHGYRALLRAFEASLDPDPLERGANLVRALEALVFPSDGKGLGAAAFGKRAACFLASSDAAAMSDCYNKVRNAALHMHDRSHYATQPLALARVDELCLLLEGLVPFVWRQVLGNPKIFESMSDARLPEFQKRLAAGDLSAWAGSRFSPTNREDR